MCLQHLRQGNDDTNVKECVNIDRFWSNVERSCIHRYIYDSSGDGYANAVIPTLDFWSPWIHERTIQFNEYYTKNPFLVFIR